MVTTLTQIREGQAPAHVAGLFLDVRRCLRTSWVPLLFRVVAAQDDLLKPVWRQLRPNLLTRSLEESADDLRAHLATIAIDLGTPLIEPVLASEGLDSDAIDEVRLVADAFHYVNPKQLVCTAALVEAAAGRTVGGAHVHPALREHLVPRQSPDDMPDVMPSPEEPDDRTSDMFRTVLRAMHLPPDTTDLRLFGRWPRFLAAAWPQLAPVFEHPALERALSRIRSEALLAAQRLPHEMTFGVDPDTLRELTDLAPVLDSLLDAMPRLALLSSALKVSLDGVEDALGSPYPVEWEGVPEGATLEF